MDIPSIAVIIAAFNAEKTIGQAVKSALMEPEVAEVIVVDDASSDGTARAASVAAEGDMRLRVIKQEQNAGPSAARNRAMKESSSPLIAVLDADDLILPGRFAQMLSVPDWDMIADNIVFCRDVSELTDPGVPVPPSVAHGDDATTTRYISLEAFLLGNIPRQGRQRGELGFLKPIIRRDVIERSASRYRVSCRLGEDFLFYSELLVSGARFAVTTHCGYAALIRENSLSSQHGLEDLLELQCGSQELSEHPGLLSAQRDAIRAFLKPLDRRVKHRRVLHIRNNDGLLMGVAAAIAAPSSIIDIFRDRWSQGPIIRETPHLLLDE